jgi:hypothetical protein
LNAQILSNNNAWGSIATVLRERQDAKNMLARQMEAQKGQLEENKKNAKTAMRRVQNTQRMEMEDNKKKAEDDLRKQ